MSEFNPTSPAPEKPSSGSRRFFSAWLARLILVAMVVLAMLAFGPTEIAWLWVGSQIQGNTESLGLALAVTFVGILVSIVILIVAVRRLERVWESLRIAAGYGPYGRSVLELVFVVAVTLTAAAFGIWFFLGGGLLPTFAPSK